MVNQNSKNNVLALTRNQTLSEEDFRMHLVSSWSKSDHLFHYFLWIKECPHFYHTKSLFHCETRVSSISALSYFLSRYPRSDYLDWVWFWKKRGKTDKKKEGGNNWNFIEREIDFESFALLANKNDLARFNVKKSRVKWEEKLNCKKNENLTYFY